MIGYGAGLLDQHAEMLRASAISPEIAHQRGYTSADTKAQLARHGFWSAQQLPPGLLIPLWTLGREVVSYQFRPDSPRAVSRGVNKYETPKGAFNVLDV